MSKDEVSNNKLVNDIKHIIALYQKVVPEYTVKKEMDYRLDLLEKFYKLSVDHDYIKENVGIFFTTNLVEEIITIDSKYKSISTTSTDNNKYTIYQSRFTTLEQQSSPHFRLNNKMFWLGLSIYLYNEITKEKLNEDFNDIAKENFKTLKSYLISAIIMEINQYLLEYKEAFSEFQKNVQKLTSEELLKEGTDKVFDVEISGLKYHMKVIKQLKRHLACVHNSISLEELPQANLIESTIKELVPSSALVKK